VERRTGVIQSSTVPIKKTNGKLEPYGFFDQFEAEMERWFRWPFTFMPRMFTAPTMHGKAWMPTMDVFEKNGTIVLKAELPGLKKEDVKVEVVGDDLLISGEAKAETQVKEEEYYRSERTFGSFYRRMPLPTGTKAEQIEATLTDGVLEVHIPKLAAAKTEATKVEVK
jgi:HSP20 family protein